MNASHAPKTEEIDRSGFVVEARDDILLGKGRKAIDN